MQSVIGNRFARAKAADGEYNICILDHPIQIDGLVLRGCSEEAELFTVIRIMNDQFNMFCG